MSPSAKKRQKIAIRKPILALLVIALPVPLANAKKDSPPTPVVVIGTFHGSMKKMKNYGPEVLKQLLADSRPEVIAAEIRPEDFRRKDTANNPWDMNQIVLPFAAKRGLKIEPIDWWPNDLRSQNREFMETLEKSEKGRATSAKISDEWAPHRETVRQFEDATAEYIHSDLFAERESNFREMVGKLVGEGPQNLRWAERAGKMNANLKRVIEKFPGKRITVVVGASHRPDIERFLKGLKSVQLGRVRFSGSGK